MSLSQASRPGARPIPLLKGALGAAVALATLNLSTGSAHAACEAGSVANTLCKVTVGGLQYDVTTFTGSYNANSSKFATPANGGVMPWWGSSSAASDFAAAVATGLGAPNSSNEGPFFGYAVVALDVSQYRFRNGTPVLDIARKALSSTYAQATLYTAPAAAAAPAPGPLPLFGAGAAFGFSRRLRKRIQGARLAIGSSQPRA
jgi:hypothetical protein